MNLWQQFSWLRPEWLWGTAPLLLLAWWSLRRHTLVRSGWQRLIAPELLQPLQQSSGSQASSLRWLPLALAWLSGCIALAGPSFGKQSLPTLKLTDAMVIVLDLSPSMLAQDVPPSRLQVAQFKILDLLAARREGYTALVVYAGSAHVVAPLSDDANTLAALVPSLSPQIMPRPGSQAPDAIAEALALLKSAQADKAQLLLFTDGVAAQSQATIVEQLAAQAHVDLHIITVGTEQGAPIPLNNGQFVRDAQGKVLMPGLNSQELQQLARATGGTLYHLPRDATQLEQAVQQARSQRSHEQSDNETEQASDHGYWLLPLIALLILLAFRRPAYLGLPSILLCGLLGAVLPIHAVDAEPAATAETKSLQWQDLWQTPDQQAAKALHDGEAEQAYQLFENPQWKGMAAYQSGHYAEAEQLFQGEQAYQHYNRGNALAQQGKLPQAIAAYEQALQQDPNLSAARDNKALLEELLKQQQEQQQEQQQSTDQNSQGEQSQSSEQTSDAQQSEPQSGQTSDQQQGDASRQPSASMEDQTAQDKDTAQTPDDTAQASEHEPQTESDDQQSLAERAKSDQETDTQKTEPPVDESMTNAEPGEPSEAASDSPSAAVPEQRSQSDEQAQALEQQLRRVPDDPAGLLRNKFYYYYQQDQRRRWQEGSVSEEPPQW